MNIEQQRLAFEATYCKHFEEKRGISLTMGQILDMREGDNYGDRPYLNGMWEGWKAAHEQDDNPVENLGFEFAAARASDDPRAEDTLVEALRETLGEHGFDVVSLEDPPVGYINEMDQPVLQEMDDHMRDVCHLGGLQLLFAREA